MRSDPSLLTSYLRLHSYKAGQRPRPTFQQGTRLKFVRDFLISTLKRLVPFRLSRVPDYAQFQRIENTSIRAPLVGFLISVAALVALALVFVLHGVLNADEGFYLAASHLVSLGFRPYHDFGYTQGPVWPYLNLPWLELYGHTLAGQRLAGLSWAIITVACGAIWLRRRHSWKSATFFVLLLLGAPLWLAFVVKGKTYALAGLAVLVGAQALQARWKIWTRWTLFIAAAAVGTGCRLPMAGFFFPAFVGLLILTPGWRPRLIAALVTLGSAIFLLMATTTADWANFLFWTTGFHRESSFYIPVWTHYWDCFRFAPVLWVVVCIPVIASIKILSSLGVARRGEPSGFQDGLPHTVGGARNDRDGEERVILVSIALGLITNLSASTTYAEYILPLLPAAALVAAPVACELFGRATLMWRVVGVIALTTAGWNYRPEFNPNVLVHAGQAEAFLRSNIPANSVVVASMPEIPVAAGARIPLGLSMGKFSVTEDFSEALARHRLMLTPAALVRVLEDPATQAIVCSPSYNWNFFWSLPSYRTLSTVARESIYSTMRRDYAVGFINEEYVIYLRQVGEQ
jgi:hypothetical protein